MPTSVSKPRYLTLWFAGIFLAVFGILYVLQPDRAFGHIGPALGGAIGFLFVVWFKARRAKRDQASQ